MTVENARRQAALTIARINNGEDLEPKAKAEAATGKTVAEAAQPYLNEHMAIHCKATSANRPPAEAKAACHRQREHTTLAA